MAGALYLNFPVLQTAWEVCDQLRCCSNAWLWDPDSPQTSPDQRYWRELAGLGANASHMCKKLMESGWGVWNFLPHIRVTVLGEVLQNWEHRGHSRMEILLVCVVWCEETALAVEGTC